MTLTGLRSLRPKGAVMCSVLSALCTSAAWAGPPFATNGAGTPDANHFEINVAAQYTRFEGGSVGTIPSVEINYGITDKLQVAILTPLAMAHADGVGTNVGLGDIQTGVKYRFIDPDDLGWRPGVAFAPSIIMPSGSEARGLGSGQIQASVPIWLSKEIDQWTVFGGGGYNINPGINRMNWWFTGIGVIRELTPQWAVGAEIFHATPTARGVKDNRAFNIGAIYNINATHHVMVSLGRNIINARENNELSTFIGYQLIF